MNIASVPPVRRLWLGLAVASLGANPILALDAPPATQPVAAPVVAARPVAAQLVAAQYGAPGFVVHPDGTLVEQPGWVGAPPRPLAPAVPPLPVTPGANRFDVVPPPGTLGQTYRRRSSLIPDDKHPRVAVVEVHLPEDVDVSARGLKSSWTGKVWRLESKEPLLPGLPHIYAIKAEKRNAEGEVISTDVRWVRLIMGRVVDLDF